MLMLYFNMGIPALAVLRIIWLMLSISRSRSGLLPSMIFGFSERVMYAELSGSGTHSSLMPCDSTRSRSLVNPSTDHLSSNFGDGRLLQMWLQPSAASTGRTASFELCCVPSLNSALRGVPPVLGAAAPAGAALPAMAPAAADWRNRLRCMRNRILDLCAHRMGENGKGRRMELLIFDTIRASARSGCERSFCHSGSRPKSPQSFSRAARLSNVNIYVR